MMEIKGDWGYSGFRRENGSNFDAVEASKVLGRLPSLSNGL